MKGAAARVRDGAEYSRAGRDSTWATCGCRRQHGTSFRRLTMRGTNGKMYPFIVQHSSSRHARAEERVVQAFRMFNECVLCLAGTQGGQRRRTQGSNAGPPSRVLLAPRCSVLERRKETRKRGIFFHTPVMVSLSPQNRLVLDDPAYISLVRPPAERARPGAPALGRRSLPAAVYRSLNALSLACRRRSMRTIASGPTCRRTRRSCTSRIGCARSSSCGPTRPAIAFVLTGPCATDGVRALVLTDCIAARGLRGHDDAWQKLEQLTHRLDVFDNITTRLVPTDVLSQVGGRAWLPRARAPTTDTHPLPTVLPGPAPC